MLAGGVPEPRADHVEAVADAALAMLEALSELDDPRARALAMRIGVHTGQLVAGVIGKRKLIYDLWGDTVNVASRMESHGEPGKIQVVSCREAGMSDADSGMEQTAVEAPRFAGRGKGLTLRAQPVPGHGSAIR